MDIILKTMKKPETKFKEKVLRDLASIPNSWFTKIQQVGIRGTPDIMGVVAGIFVGIELKATLKSKSDMLQEYNINAINKAGGVGVFVYPETWDVTFQELQKIASQMNDDGVKYLS